MTQNDGSGWRDTIASMTHSNAIEHEVAGTKIRFHPLSVAMLSKLRQVGRPLAQAIGALFSKNQDDSGTEYTQSDDTTIDVIDDVDESGQPVKKRVLVGVQGSNTKREPITVQMAQFRADQKERAIDRIVETFTDHNNLRVLAALVFDSCREIFPRRPSDSDLDEFISEHANTAIMGQFLAGLMKANAQSLGKLGEQLTESVAKAVRTRISENDAGGETEGQTPTSSPTEDESQKAKASPPPPPPEGPANLSTPSI